MSWKSSYIQACLYFYGAFIVFISHARLKRLMMLETMAESIASIFVDNSFSLLLPPKKSLHTVSPLTTGCPNKWQKRQQMNGTPGITTAKRIRLKVQDRPGNFRRDRRKTASTASPFKKALFLCLIISPRTQ